MRRVDIALEGKEHLNLLDDIRCGVIHVQRQTGAGEDTVLFPASVFEGSKNETTHILDVILLRLSQLPVNVFRRSKEPLIAVCTLAGAYILVSALVIFNVEPDSFDTFFDAIYWATVSLTTMGYGDIYPITTAGRIITMISSIFGIAIVALPAGIITAGYMNEINDKGE